MRKVDFIAANDLGATLLYLLLLLHIRCLSVSVLKMGKSVFRRP